VSYRFGFEVFSVSNCGERRNSLAKNSRKYLSKFFTHLDVKTVGLTSKEDMARAIEEHWPLAFLKFHPSDQFNCWGQVGIISSTYLACKKLIESDLDGILLVEDDVVLEEGFGEAITRNISQINNSWDLFFQFRPDGESGANESLDFQPNIGSLGAYVISRSGADKMIADCIRGIKYPLDLQYFKSLSRFRRYAVGRGSAMFCHLDEDASCKSTITKTQTIT
jgi:hypothetical protein